MRDQIIRGRLLVDRLKKAGRISTSKSLVVVGAGVGGATAALYAASLRIKTVLIEKAAFPFMRQEFAETRFFNAAQYDWPVDHWTEQKFPWVGSSDFEIVPGTGYALCLAWRTKFSNLANRHSAIFSFIDSCTVSDIVVLNAEESQVTLENDLRAFSCGAVIWACGLGEEDCFAPDKISPTFEGQAFWNKDEFASVHATRPGATVLISGSGDGALQDFLRVQTGFNTAAEVFLSIDISERDKQALLYEIQGAEDRAARGWSWASDDEDNASFRRLLNKTQMAWVHKILAQPDAVKSIENIVQNVSIDIVYRSKFLTAFYSLNRFLTLLLTEYIASDHNKKRDRKKVLHNETWIKTIYASDNHKCVEQNPHAPPDKRAAGKYDSMNRLTVHNCFGKDHDVTFDTNSMSPMSDGPYNFVIIRHGIGRKPVLPGTRSHLSEPPRPRHLWPYDLP